MLPRLVEASLVLLFASTSTVQAQCQPENPVGGSFVEPPPCGGSAGPTTYRDNRVLMSGDVQEISWTTNMTESDFYNLTLWQQDGTGGAIASNTPLYIHNENAPVLESLNWVVQVYELDLDRSDVFYLEMGWDGPRFFSHYFNISRSATTSSTSSPARTTATSSQTSTQPSAATSSQAPEDGSNGGLSQDAKIGLGVGIGVGVPIVLLLGIISGILVSKSRKSKANPMQETSGPTNLVEKPYGPTDDGPYEFPAPSGGPHEVGQLSEWHYRHELAAPNNPREMQT